jgi:hypothetical protein
LFGDRKLDQTYSAIPTVAFAPAPITNTVSSSSHAAVFNPDGQLGLSCWFNPNLKLTVSYRVDAYFNALRTFDTAGNIVNVDRIYHGPMLRFTSNY